MWWSDSFNGSRKTPALRAVSVSGALLLLLALGSCSGGGNGGGGGGGGNAVTVAISPTAAAVQLNQTLQMSAAVSNAPSLDIAATNGAVRASNVVTITTTAAHGFSVGQSVTVQGVTDTSFLGTFVIQSVPSPTTLTYNQTGSDASSGGGTIPKNAVTWQVNGMAGGSTATGTISNTGLYTAPANLPPITTATIASSGAVRSGNTVTITTTAAHTFTVGQVISILGVAAPPPLMLTITASGAVRASNTVTITTSAAHGLSIGQVVTITGVTDSSFNGSFTVSSIPSTTTFTYFQSGTDASSGGGTATANIGGFDGVFVIATVPSTTTFTYTQVGTNATSGGGTANSSAVKITAVSVADTTKSADASVGLDSGITLSLTPTTVTLAAGNPAAMPPVAPETFQFVATVSGPTPSGVEWSVNNTVGGSATVGTITTSGLYTAPNAVPAPATVSVKAQATADPTKSAAASVTINSSANTPTLTAVWPTVFAEGSVAQDLYLTGTNFLSTSVVRIGGMPLPTPPSPIGSTLARVRAPNTIFDQPGALTVEIATQGGTVNPPCTPNPCEINVLAQRPALVGPSPDSIPFGAGTVNLNFNGGYYSSSVQPEFQGVGVGTSGPTADPSRQMQVILTGSETSPAGGPGLYPVGVRNSGSTPALAVANLAIRPTPAAPTTNTFAIGAMPGPVAINTATGIAVVLNRGDVPPTISLIDLASETEVARYSVGMGVTGSTGLAVDSVRNLAVVANNGSNSISIIDLASGALLPSGAPITDTNISSPFAVAINPHNGLALVARNSTTGLAATQATIIDLVAATTSGAIVLGTVGNTTTPVSTGANPAVAVDPRLNWAFVTPGGIGPLTIVSLGERNPMGGLPIGAGVVVTAQLGNNFRGISVNMETRGVFIVDPTSTAAALFSGLDQSRNNVSADPTSCGTPPCPLETGHVDTAVNPLTNIGLSVNPSTDLVSVYDLAARTRLLTFAVGADPVSVDVDPGSNKAVIANEADGTVTIAALGSLRAQHILDVNPPTLPTSAGDLTITVTGFGFTGAAVVRADETPLATTVVSSRQLTATVPAAMLTGAARFAIDVLDGGGATNVFDLAVIQSIAVGDAPVAVAIDPERNFALVANSGSDNASLVDLGAGMVTNTITVGDNPQGAAFFSRRGIALVSNRTSNNVSILDTDPASATFATVKATISTGTEPLGIGINDATGEAVIANSVSNTLTTLDAFSGAGINSISVGSGRPVAAAVDPTRNLAAVANSSSNSVAIVDLDNNISLFSISNVQGANGVLYDPVSDRFIVTAALRNEITVIDPVARTATTSRVGINPTSIAYNNNSSTLVTVNTASNTVSVMDFLDRRIRALLPLAASTQGAVAIHPRTNVAVIADTANDRILLVLLPR
jgi:DNA-binding beta-propeller fold protein YncE